MAPLRCTPIAAVLTLLCLVVSHDAVAAPEGREALVAAARAPWKLRSLEVADAGILHPTGLAHSRSRDVLFVLEPVTGGASGWRIVSMGPMEVLLGDVEVPIDAASPLRMTFDERHDRLLLYDDATPRLYSVGVQADGRVDARTLERLDPPHVGPIRAAGMTSDPATGLVYVLDRLSRRVLAFTPDSTRAGDPDVKRRRGDASWIRLGELAALDLQGIAFDPLEDNLQLFDPVGRILYEVTLSGQLVGANDLGATDMVEPRDLLFAPSGDQTDDPATHSLYVADARRPIGTIFEMSLGAQQPVTVEATLATATLVRTIDTSIWPVPSPDPSGLTFDAARGVLLLVDGEVEETRQWRDVNFYELSLSGTYLRGADLTDYSIEPVGVTKNPTTGQTIVSDDDARRVFIISPGPDGVVGGTGDVVTSFSTTAFGSGDPEGITYDRLRNRLYIADGVNAEVYEISAGPNGVFDGTSSPGDDQVTHFDVSRLGIGDPETVEYNEARGTLFIVGSGDHDLLEITTTGTLVNTFDVSAIDSDHFAGMAFAPGSTAPTATHLYISDRKVDNDSNSSENDGQIYEVSLDAVPPPPPPGSAPTGFRIAAGADDAEESASGSVSLTGGDLEMVMDGNRQTVGLRFTNVAIPNGARVDSAFIQFKADEAQNEATRLVFRAHLIDNAPAFTSQSRNVSSRARTVDSVVWVPPAWTSNAAGAAQRSPNLAPIVQRLVNRAGWNSGNAIAFIVTGTGRRVAETFEGESPNAAVLRVSIATGPPPVPTNTAPVVDAGPGLSLVHPIPGLLNGTVSDDGLPTGSSVTTRWTQGGGPAGVIFLDDRAVDTQAIFPGPGTFLLRLTASDGALSAVDSVTVDVRAPGTIPVTVEKRVAGGNDDAEEKSSGSMSLTSSDLEFVLDGSNVQKIAMRFTGLNIPRGADITAAWIQFKADEATTDTTRLTIRAQASDNAATFASSSGNISNRSLTSSSAQWIPQRWTVAGESGLKQRTSDFSDVLDELTRRPTWTSTSPVVIVVTGSGRRIARAFEKEAAGAALLHVEYLH